MSELLPTKHLAIESVVCTDDERRYDFHAWQDKTLLPALRERPGIIDIHRYYDLLIDFGESGHGRYNPPADGTKRYLNVYRLNSSDPWELMQDVGEEISDRADDEGIDFMDVLERSVWEFNLFRRTARHGERVPYARDGMPQTIFPVFISPVEGEERNLDDWWLNTHARDLLETPGLEKAHRYDSLNPDPADDEFTNLMIYEINAEDPEAVCRALLHADDELRRPHGRFSHYASLEGTTHSQGVFGHWAQMTPRP